MEQNVNIPTIRGRIAERMQRAPKRDRNVLEFVGEPEDVILRSPNERGAVALALLILDSLSDNGGTRAPHRTVDSVLKRLLATMGAKEIMDIEIEAYETLLWIGKAIDPDWKTEQLSADDIDPTTGQPALIQWAIAKGHDLELDYYSRNRGELTHRRITPISLEAETYLHAYCHLRRDERIFRISRIAELNPVGGWKKVDKAEKKAEPVDDTTQMSLLGD